MRRAIIPALLLVLVSVVLGATVFREQVANAAATLMVREQNTDAQGNIKVHEQGTAAVRSADSTQVLFDGVITANAAEAATINVSSAREMRLVAVWPCPNGDESAHAGISVMRPIIGHPNDLPTIIDSIDVPCYDGVTHAEASRLYELPGTAIQVWTFVSGMHITLFGRS